MEERIKMYIDKCRLFIKFMITSQQWSGVSSADIDRWLYNFNDLDVGDQYLVYKLLVNTIYFSEKDVIDLLDDGLHNRVFRPILLSKQINCDFQLSAKAIQNIVSDEIASTAFIPLLDSDSPHESGNYILRLLVQQGIICSSQSFFLEKTHIMWQNKPFRHLIITDDCLGSGDQLRGFWAGASFDVCGSRESLKTFCEENGIDVSYFVLFGYKKSVEELQKDLPGLQILCMKNLDDENRVFRDASYVWTDTAETERAKDLFVVLRREMVSLLTATGD